MAVLLANNATSRLASSLTDAATTLSVTSGEGAKFPSPTGGDWFPLTLIKSSGALEILRCTARSGDVLTVTRAQEGTAAQAFSAGDRVEVRITKAVMDAIVQQINDLSNSALLDANNLSDLTNAATARTNLGLGTAATKNAQTSPTDTTGGALMAVGAFGLGVSNMPITSDIDAISTNMVFHVSASNAKNPFYGYGASGLNVQEGQTYGWQLIGVDSGDFALKGRVKTNGTWSAWIDLWTNGNLPVTAFAKTLLDDADAAAAKATLQITEPLGVGQTWQDVTASRSISTTYTNTTGRPIAVSIEGYMVASYQTLTLTVNGVVAARCQQGGYGVALFSIVPAGATYVLTPSANWTLITWAELRV